MFFVTFTFWVSPVSAFASTSAIVSVNVILDRLLLYSKRQFFLYL